MTVEDQRIPQIEKDFENHKATYQKVSEDIEILTWAEPGTMINKVVYLVYKNTLFIKGDLGEAVFSWYPSISLNAISGFNLDYFAEKCEASEGGKRWREWDNKKAKEAVVYYFRDMGRSNRLELFKRFRYLDGFEALYCKEEWVEWIHFHDDECNEIFGGDYWEFLYNVGDVYPWRMQAWLVGIKMGMNQLKELDNGYV